MEVLASLLPPVPPLLAVRILIEQIFGPLAPSSMAVAETDVADWPLTNCRTQRPFLLSGTGTMKVAILLLICFSATLVSHSKALSAGPGSGGGRAISLGET